MARKFAAALAVTVIAIVYPRQSPAQPAQPNVVVIVADDLGYNETGFTSALTNRTTQFLTPNLDALAAQSVVMRQGYAVGPLCGPSRAGLLLGDYQQRTGNEENTPTDINNPFGFIGSETLLSDRMKALGYTTGAIGKWHGGFINGVNRPLDMGFDEFFGFLSGSRQYYLDVAPANIMMRNNTPYEFNWRTEGNQGLYDPVKGRYATDAFGEESASFINRHANDANPFFLYMAPNAAHTPYAVKQSDYALFSNITDETKRQQAAVTYAFDRAVGMTLNALTTNGLDDNTIVVFIGDNGGTAFNDNGPYRGFKGYTWEGGIRIPYTIKAPGLTPGVYNAPVNFYDLTPTLVTAAGGTVAPEDTAGVDLFPYLQGAQTGDPHQVMFWRNRSFWAVRKGDWKLARPNEPQYNLYALYNEATDPSEQTNLINVQTAIRDELYRDFTLWEATLAKPRFGVLGVDDRHIFDHFVYRADQATNGNWNAGNIWYQAGTQNAVTLYGDDAYANGIFEFTTRDDASYTATNGVFRMSGLTFMLNQLRFTGDFAGAADRTGTLNGNALLFVNDLNGNAPQIQLSATGASTPRFGFNLNNQLQLVNDLQITGDGTQDFVISGVFQDYYLPRGITKLGASRVTLSGANTFTGDLVVTDGEIKIAGANAGINGAAKVAVNGPGVLTLSSGLIRTAKFDLAGGGIFNFQGGSVHLTGGGSDFGFNRFDIGSLDAATLTLKTAATAATSAMHIGDVADGQLTLEAGSALTTVGDVTVAFANTGTPAGSLVLVDGGTWAINGGLTVGQQGKAMITVRSGGTLSIQGVANLAADPGSSANVTVGGAGAGTVSSLAMNVGGSNFGPGGSGSLTINAGGAVAVPGDFKILAPGAVNLQGGTLAVGSFEKAPSGAFNWSSGALTVTGPQGLDVDSDGPLGSSISLSTEQTLGATSVLRVKTGGSLAVGSGAISTPVVELDGGTFTAASLAGVGALHFNSGVVNLTGNGTVSIGPGGITGGVGAIVVGPGGELGASVVLNPGDELHDSGTTLLPVGGSLTVNGGIFTTNTLQLDGGLYSAPDLSGVNSLVFNSGTIALTSDLNIVAEGPFGAVVNVTSGQILSSTGGVNVGLGGSPGALTIQSGGEVQAAFATTIDSQGSLTLAGGRLTTQSLSNSAGGVFDWQSGTLKFSDGLHVAAGQSLGDAVTIGADRTLEVVNSLHVGSFAAPGSLTIAAGGLVKAANTTLDTQGTITLSGGKLSTSLLTRTPGSTFDWQSGTLEFTGDTYISVLGDLGATVSIGADQTLRTLGSMYVGTPIDPGDLTVGVGGVVETLGVTYIDAVGVVHLAGGSLTTADLEISSGGTFDWQSGHLGVTGVGGLAVDSLGPLGANLTLGADKSLSVTGDLSVASGAAIVSTADNVAAGSLSLNGGSYTAPTLAGIGAVNFNSGAMAVTGPAGVMLAAGSPLGASLTIDSSKSLTVVSTTAISTGASLVVAGGAFSTQTLALSGGSFTGANLGGVSAVQFDAGALTLTDGSGITMAAGQPLGASLDLTTGKELHVGGQTTVPTGGAITVSDGVFTSGGVQLTGGSLSISALTGLGPVVLDSGSLSVIGAAGLTIDGASQLGPVVSIEAGDALQVTNTATLGVGGSLTVAGGQFTAGALALSGGSYTAADLAGVGPVSFSSGALHLTGVEGVTIGPASQLGANLTVDAGKSLSVNSTTSIVNGGVLAVAGGSFSTGVLALNGGKYVAANLAGPSSFQFNSGTLEFTGDKTVTADGDLQQALGGQLIVGAGRRLVIDGTATLNAMLRVGGGSLSVGNLVNPALLDFDAGTFDLTATDLTFGAGGLFGGNYTLDAGKQLNVTQTVAIDAGSLLTINNAAGLAAGTLANQGEVVLGGISAVLDAGSLSNTGILRGYGRIAGAVVNQSAGEIIANPGDRLRFLGPTIANSGRISALGVSTNPAEIEFDGAVTNDAGAGVITGSNARVRFLGGLANNGSISLTGGDNHVFGDISSAAGSEILVTGGASATFYDDVHNEGTLRVSKIGTTISQAVFVGAVTGAGGSTGGGTIFFEGDLRPGNSPAIVTYGNDVYFGSNAMVEIEIGGANPGTGYDQINVLGSLGVGGQLHISLLNNFTPTVGASYNILTATTGLSGSFSSMVLPALGAANQWQLAYQANAVVLSVILDPSFIISADFNGDGFIDGADLLVWQRGLGITSGATRVAGDANYDGAVDQADLTVWKSQFGNPAPTALSAVQSVPEPSSLLLAIGAALVASSRRGLVLR
jgi:autotransporter-associated beta strand protein